MILLLSACIFVSDKELEAWMDADGDGEAALGRGGTDCNDADATSQAGPAPLFTDADGDAHGDPTTEQVSCPSEGLVALGDDCDDTNPDVFSTTLAYADADSDGYGDPSVTTEVCGSREGWVDTGDDCNDNDPTHNTELANYRDADGDGWGTADEIRYDCDWLDGWSSLQGDCDDADPTRNPGEQELPGTPADDDCDGDTADAMLGEVGVFFTGDLHGAEIGRAGAPVGDMNGDGYGDIAVGLPGRGEVRLVGGLPEVNGGVGIQAIEVSGARSTWEDGVSGAGTSLAMGDVDADGEVDLVAGAPGDAGLVAVFEGRFAASALVPDATLSGSGDTGALGSALVVGEFTGDGVEDLAVSAPGASAVYLLSGPFNGDTIAADSAMATFHLPGPAGATPGLALADIDGDGREDAVIGASWHDVDGVDDGLVLVCAGGAPGDYDADADCNAHLRGDSSGDAFGAAVAADDVNHDGYADIVVGAPGWDGAVADQGAVYVFLGAETRFYAPLAAADADVALQGAVGADATGGRAGAAVAIVGNMAGSSGLDLVIGAPDWNDPYTGYGTGAAFVWLGPWQAGTTSLDDAEERFTCGFPEDAYPVGCSAGSFVGPAGDVDGDGLADALVGATGWVYNTDPLSQPGALVVVFGRNIH